MAYDPNKHWRVVGFTGTGADKTEHTIHTPAPDTASAAKVFLTIFPNATITRIVYASDKDRD